MDGGQSTRVFRLAGEPTERIRGVRALTCPRSLKVFRLTTSSTLPNCENTACRAFLSSATPHTSVHKSADWAHLHWVRPGLYSFSPCSVCLRIEDITA